VTTTCDVAAVPRPVPVWQRVIANPLVQRFARAASWNAVATAVSRLFLLVAMIGAARWLGREQVGALGTVQNTMGMFGVFAGCGLGVTTTRFVAQNFRVSPDRAARVTLVTWVLSVALGLTVSLICWAISPWLASEILHRPELTDALKLGSWLVLFGALNGVQNGVLIGREEFRRLAMINVVGGVVSLLLILRGAQTAGLPGALWGMVNAQGIQCALGLLLVCQLSWQSWGALAHKETWGEVGPIVRFAIPIAISSMTVFPSEWIATAMLVRRPDGLAEMGLYSAATQWFNAVLLVPMVVGQACLPMLSERWALQDRQGFLRVMGLAMVANCAAVFPLVVVGVILSGWLMGHNGPEFVHGWPILCLLLAATLVIAVQTPVGQALQASSQGWWGLATNLGWAAAFLTLCSFLVTHGAVGIASSRLIAYIAHTVWVSAVVLWVIFRPSPAVNRPAGEH
jgi:O-antigen/teichoic acid export membrane protein